MPKQKKGEEIFFYTTREILKWGDEFHMDTENPKTHEPITSLEEAEEIAESFKVSYGQNRCVTTYGSYFKTE